MPVEALSPSNLAEVVAIEAQSPATHWTEDMLRRVMTDTYMRGVVWREDGTVCGYCVYGLLVPSLEILNIVVAPTHRRQGVARQILSHIFELSRAEKCTEAFLEVRVSNAGAIMLYKSLGFSEINTRKKYYRDGEDGLVMSAQLV